MRTGHLLVITYTVSIDFKKYQEKADIHIISDYSCRINSISAGRRLRLGWVYVNVHTLKVNTAESTISAHLSYVLVFSLALSSNLQAFFFFFARYCLPMGDTNQIM